jgi:hypothetical protein
MVRRAGLLRRRARADVSAADRPFRARLVEQLELHLEASMASARGVPGRRRANHDHCVAGVQLAADRGRDAGGGSDRVADQGPVDVEPHRAHPLGHQ